MGKYFREFRVYALNRADGRPFYIGKGSRGRYRDHLRHARNGGNSLKCKIIRRMLAEGETVGYEIIRECTTAAEATELECQLIATYGRLDLGTGILANHTDGGEGAYVVSDDLRRRISERTRAAMTPEIRERLRALAKAQMADPEFKVRFSELLKAVQNDPEKIAANRARGLKQATRPGERERLSRASKAYNSTPEARAANSASRVAMWADPVWRAKVLAAQAAGKAARRARLNGGER